MPDFASVCSWPTCEVNKQILVLFHCDGEGPQWIVPEQPEITNDEWVYRGRTEHFINAHIQVWFIRLSGNVWKLVSSLVSSLFVTY